MDNCYLTGGYKNATINTHKEKWRVEKIERGWVKMLNFSQRNFLEKEIFLPLKDRNRNKDRNRVKEISLTYRMEIELWYMYI